jgi:hypothetical protein
MDQLSAGSLTQTYSHAALAAGTTTTFSTTGATLYSIRGKSYTTSAAANAATPTTDAVTGAAFRAVGLSKGGVFVFCYDGTSATAATAIKVVQGSIEDLDSAADGANAVFNMAIPKFPGIPATLCPFGYMVVKVGASGTAFTFGTSNLAAVSNVSKSFQSVNTLPDRPQAS